MEATCSFRVPGKSSVRFRSCPPYPPDNLGLNPFPSRFVVIFPAPIVLVLIHELERTPAQDSQPESVEQSLKQTNCPLELLVSPEVAFDSEWVSLPQGGELQLRWQANDRVCESRRAFNCPIAYHETRCHRNGVGDRCRSRPFEKAIGNRRSYIRSCQNHTW